MSHLIKIYAVCKFSYFFLVLKELPWCSSKEQWWLNGLHAELGNQGLIGSVPCFSRLFGENPICMTAMCLLVGKYTQIYPLSSVL